MSKGFTRSIIKQRMDAAVSAIESAVCFVDEMNDDDPKHCHLMLTLSAELQLLATIAIDWESGFYNPEYPAELPLIAAIRGNLGLTATPSKQQKMNRSSTEVKV